MREPYFDPRYRPLQARELLGPLAPHEHVAVVVIVHPRFEQAGDLVTTILRDERAETAIELRTSGCNHRDDVAGIRGELGRQACPDRDASLHACLRRPERQIAPREVMRQARDRTPPRVRLDAD